MSRPNRDVKGRLDETTIRSSVKSRNLIEQMCRLVEERLPREWPFVQTTQRMMVDALVWNAVQQGDDAIVRIVQDWRIAMATPDGTAVQAQDEDHSGETEGDEPGRPADGRRPGPTTSRPESSGGESSRAESARSRNEHFPPKRKWA